MPTASQWQDAIVRARRAEHTARLVADHQEIPAGLPGDPGTLEDLRSGRAMAARFEADTWRRYAEHAEACFASAADAEMTEQDRAEAAQESQPLPELVSVTRVGAPVRNALGEIIEPKPPVPFHMCTARNCATCRR